jgi:phage-related protein
MFYICTKYGTLKIERMGCMNKVIWNKRALKEVKEFPEEIRKEIGYLLYVLQVGESIDMPHSRPMPSFRYRCS